MFGTVALSSFRNTEPFHKAKDYLLCLPRGADHLCLVVVTALSSPHWCLLWYYPLSQHCIVSHTLGLQSFHSGTEFHTITSMNWRYSLISYTHQQIPTLSASRAKWPSRASASSSASSRRYIGLLISTFSCIRTCMNGFPLKVSIFVFENNGT